MAKTAVTGPVILPATRFSTSFSEIFLIFIIIAYESICFLLLVLASLAVGRSLETVIKDAQILRFVSVTVNPAALQCALAICFLPLAALIYEIIEGQIIRPAINRARNNYPYMFANIPSILSIILVFYAFWNVISLFHERFDIFIEQDEFPLQCLVVDAKSVFRYAVPCKVRDCWFKVDEELLEEARNTNLFILSLFYLSYFLWKWALKYIPGESMRLSNSAMMSLKVNTVLTLITLLSAGVLENFSKGLVIPPDILMIPVAIGIAFLAQFFPWNVLFSSNDEETDEVNGNAIVNPNEHKISTGIHGLFFILTTSALVFVFFGVEMEEDYYADVNFKTILSPAIKQVMKDKLKEQENAVKWSTGAFRGMFGFQIIMFLRTMIGSRFG